jgi:RpiB/LacA/LacB family sugar-phosphate isomerase
LREQLAQHAREGGHEVTVVGAPSEEAYDYPDAADEGVAEILSGRSEFGVFVCGSGVGICMRANRHKGIRGAPVTTVEAAKLTREHNNANVLCFGQRTIEPGQALAVMDAFLAAPSSPEERHKRRVSKLDGNV